MRLLNHLRLLLSITRSHGLIRRYFAVNGFDGALTMLGLNMGFLVGGETAVGVMLTASLGAAVALFMSGVTSAFISEWEERKRSLAELEAAMVTDLSDSVHASAAKAVPVVIALVNGLAPLTISVVIVTPLILARLGFVAPFRPIEATIATSFVVIFLLGVFLGRVGGSFWLWSGLRSALVAALTALIILAVGTF